MLKGSLVGLGDLSIPAWHIGNGDDIFTGTCLKSGPAKLQTDSSDYREGSCTIWIHGSIPRHPLTK